MRKMGLKLAQQETSYSRWSFWTWGSLSNAQQAPKAVWISQCTDATCRCACSGQQGDQQLARDTTLGLEYAYKQPPSCQGSGPIVLMSGA